ncbi:hypothetical protein H2201_005511 [Coniosporium apollinis]|uniref:Mid2 domain-containing protein n=1 Tax=Coniosporium apollinis TaxID=61459 RepID=A0ABQ9NPV0_9PEZI|nr:hypothetical protein H2201_005511 [Coniosporium apollinis]
MFGLLPHRVINAIIAVSFALPVSADYFTNPASFVTINESTTVKTQDLSTSFTLGQTVQITWATTLNSISLTLARWDVNKGVTVASFLTNEPNPAFYTWTIGANDGIDEDELSISPNFCFQLHDPTGEATSTDNPKGFINHTLTSRGFVIKSNLTSPSASPTVSASPRPTSTSTPGLGMEDKISISIGVVGGVAVIAALLWYFRFRRRRALSHNDRITDDKNHAVGPNMDYAEMDSAETGLYEAANSQQQYTGNELDGSTAFHTPRAELSAGRI